MSSENANTAQKSRVVGRSFWDLIIGGSYVVTGLIILIIMGIFMWLWLGKIPSWFYISVISSFLFIPFLLERAKQDAELFMIIDEPFSLTEYRIGRKYGLQIAGNGTIFQSNSGVQRMLLTAFDQENKIGYASSFGELSQIDQVRDMNTLTHLSEILEQTLRESRENTQTLGVAVEMQAKEIVDWALKIIQGSLIPNEVSELFGIDQENTDIENQNDEMMDIEFEEGVDFET